MLIPVQNGKRQRHRWLLPRGTTPVEPLAVTEDIVHVRNAAVDQDLPALDALTPLHFRGVAISLSQMGEDASAAFAGPDLLSIEEAFVHVFVEDSSS